ncbi:O-unit flippase-like protein [Kosakonia sacchari]|uniref:O-unit flippase-like protein n=1 Tax=Kosakonia sacchari TaxID=1158459 RepID=UPI000BE4FB63|nr:O-unit flippase-like protein [Kosakonia sacchari]PDO89449.1 hypothetical protein BK797_00210 [Kosakonia sacchari]
MIKQHYQLLIGLVNQGFNILTPFIVTIIGLKYIDAVSGSIWLIFLSMVVLINLLDFGLSPTIIRNVSYVVGGARKLAKNGLDDIEFYDSIDFSLLSRLVLDIKKIYRVLTLIGLVIIGWLGSVYFYSIAPESLKIEALASWGIFAVGLLMNLYYLYYTPLLCGFGVIQDSYKANILGRICWLLFTGGAILLSPSILTFSLSFLLSVIVNRIFIKHLYQRHKYVAQLNNNLPQKESTIPYIAHNAVKLGTVSLGSFLISRSTVLIAGASLPLVVAGQYTFSLQVYMALLAVGNVFVTVKVPILSQQILQNNKSAMKKLIIQILTFSLGLYLFGFVLFYFLQSYIISIFHSNVTFLDSGFLLLLAVVYLLELNHTICATILTTANKVPFVKPSLVSGILIVLISYLLMKFTTTGVLGLIIAQGLIQLLYNNWKWPCCVYKDYIR